MLKELVFDIKEELELGVSSNVEISEKYGVPVSFVEQIWNSIMEERELG